MLNIKKHTIKPRDTAESIAQQYDVTVEDMYKYHNKHCLPHDYIQYNITYQTEIFIPPTKEEQRLLDMQFVKFVGNNTLHFSASMDGIGMEPLSEPVTDVMKENRYVIEG
jgi:hypothetical protein